MKLVLLDTGRVGTLVGQDGRMAEVRIKRMRARFGDRARCDNTRYINIRVPMDSLTEIAQFHSAGYKCPPGVRF